MLDQMYLLTCLFVIPLKLIIAIEAHKQQQQTARFKAGNKERNLYFTKLGTCSAHSVTFPKQ